MHVLDLEAMNSDGMQESWCSNVVMGFENEINSCTALACYTVLGSFHLHTFYPSILHTAMLYFVDYMLTTVTF